MCTPNGPRQAKNNCLTIANGLGSLLEKCVTDPFVVTKKKFGIFHGRKRVNAGSKWAKITCFSIPNGPKSLVEKYVFAPFLTHFWSPNGPFLKHFGMFHRIKHVTAGSKRAKNICLRSLNGLGTTLEKMNFFAPGPLLDPVLAPTVRGPCCPVAPPSHHWYGSVGVLVGDSEAWKPQKVEGCGWTRCRWNCELSHVAQDNARSWFRGCLTQSVHGVQGEGGGGEREDVGGTSWAGRALGAGGWLPCFLSNLLGGIGGGRGSKTGFVVCWAGWRSRGWVGLCMDPFARRCMRSASC